MPRAWNKTGLLPPIDTLGDNLTKLGLPTPQTPAERTISAVDQPIASTLLPMGVGSRLAASASPTVSAVGDALTARPVIQAAAAGAGGLATEATGDPRIGTAVSIAGPLLLHGAGQWGSAIENTAIGGISKPDAELGRLALDKYNIPIGAPDLTDNSLIRIGADQAGKLPFSGAAPAAAAKQAAWQGAIATEMGDPTATSFTPDVMDASRQRIGSAFTMSRIAHPFRLSKATNLFRISIRSATTRPACCNRERSHRFRIRSMT